MLQIADLEKYTETDIPALLNQVRPILNKRTQLHNRYMRDGGDNKVMYSGTPARTVLPFEKYITDLATGYTAGKPTYNIEAQKDEQKAQILFNLLDKEAPSQEYVDQMKTIIDYITNYNDDNQECYELIHDIFEYSACYEIIYENQLNEIVYSKYDPIETVATWDYSIPANLTGLVRVWNEKNLYASDVTMIELTDKNGSRTFEVNGKEVKQKERNNFRWGDVPAIAVEVDAAIFEPCEDLIEAYEQLVQNTRNTYQYNDTDCKLMFMNYTAENPLTIINEEGQTIINPARKLEDDLVMQAKTFYVGQDGDVKWLSKPVDATGIETILKLYLDGMFQLAGIPNTSDLAFNGNDLNAAAIDRKFYVMNMMTTNAISELKKALLRRWELILNRINLKKQTRFDFRDITVDIPKNLPANNDEMADYYLKLKDMLSSETILTKLGFNAIAENEKLQKENEEAMQMNLEQMQMTGTDQPMEDQIDEQQ